MKSTSLKTSPSTHNQIGQARVSLARRLVAITYDALLLLGVLFFASIPLALVSSDVPQQQPWLLLKQAYLLGVIYLFFAGFWTHGGQTLGMRAWRIRLVTNTGESITWGLSLKRFLYSILSWLVLGLGFVWVLFDDDKLAWHDRLSASHLILLPKKNRSKD